MQWFEKCKCGQFKNTSEHNCIYTNKDLMIKHLEEKLKAAMCEANACPQLCDVVIPEFKYRDSALLNFYKCSSCGCTDILDGFVFCPFCGKKIKWGS